MMPTGSPPGREKSGIGDCKMPQTMVFYKKQMRRPGNGARKDKRCSYLRIWCGTGWPI